MLTIEDIFDKVGKTDATMYLSWYYPRFYGGVAKLLKLKNLTFKEKLEISYGLMTSEQKSTLYCNLTHIICYDFSGIMTPSSIKESINTETSRLVLKSSFVNVNEFDHAFAKEKLIIQDKVLTTINQIFLDKT